MGNGERSWNPPFSRTAEDDRTVRGLLVVGAAMEAPLGVRTQLRGDLDAAREALWDHFRTGGEGERGIPREAMIRELGLSDELGA